MIFRTPFLLRWLYPQLVWRIPGPEKVIYLTFDDGPMPGPTDFVLSELDRVKAQATFFCIGDNVRKHPETFRAILAAGHRYGNHTFNHLKGWNCGTPEYVNNTRLCETQFAIAQQITDHHSGVTPEMNLFRPPYGRIRRRQIRELNQYRIVMWDVLTFDYEARISDDSSLKGSIRATRPGSIVVFHDSLKAERKLRQILPPFLDHFAALGFSFKAIPIS